MSLEASLEALKVLFKDNPDALTVLNLKSITSEYLKGKLKDNEEKLFASPINLWVTGRTHAGKTSLGNSLLDSKLMKSTGHQDCTDFVGFFKLADNLRYYDVPGSASDSRYENINRVALLMPQIEDEDVDPPVVEMQDSDTFYLKDFSNCTNPKDEPKTQELSVGDWQSPEQQKEVSPDVIVYVCAPHMHFLRPDRQYLRQLLQTWQKRKKPCIVIPALNIFEKDGKVQPSSQNIEDANKNIKTIYHKIYGDEWCPPIIEINSLKGTGIEQLTDIICQILPQEKIGKMQQVLKDDLKQYAEKELVTRYYHTLSLIAGRLAFYKSDDKKLGGQGIFFVAAEAIVCYGVMIFNAEALDDIQGQMDVIVEKVQQVEESQQKDITTKENIEFTEQVEHKEPVYEKKRKPKLKKVPKQVEATEYLDVSHTYDKIIPRKGVGRVLDMFSHKTETVTETTTVPITTTKTVEVEETVYKKKKVLTGFKSVYKPVKFTKQIEKLVGKEALEGGYPLVEFLIGLGISIKHFCSDEKPDLLVSMSHGNLLVEQKFSQLESKIKQLVEKADGESELIQLLEDTLVN